MPLFISDEDLARHSDDAPYIVSKADDFIRALQTDLDTVKAAADAASITAEQTCSLLEQKFLSLSSEFSNLQSHSSQLQSSLDDRLSEVAQLQSQKHQLHLQSIEKDGEIERLAMEISELHKSKRQLIELVEQKDLEISEKNGTITAYLDKIVNLTERAAQKEARLCEVESELARSQATCTRLSQEKELIERHNVWLNDELKAKVDGHIELRRVHADLEEDMSAKLADAEKQLTECSSSLKWNEERVKELEMKLTSVQEELYSSKDAAAANEERFSAELSTVNKLVELYKESSEEWSRKAGELEGVIKALESHLSQVENDYKERLEKEVSARKQLEKDAMDLKDKLERCEAEVESSRKACELKLLPFGSFSMERWTDLNETNDVGDESRMLVPKIPVGVSGTALAASLLRDGWSLAKMYAKYQEAVDALRHEQLGRKESEAILQRVLCELEEKAGIILDERAEYERMVESYSVINQKLQHSISERGNLEKTIQELKAELRRHERDYSFAQKDINDLQKQVTVLLKECRDIQVHCGSVEHDQVDDRTEIVAIELDTQSATERIISERLLTFKDINGLVEQNVQLRRLVRTLSDQIENSEMQFKEKLDMELRKHTDEAASKVAAVLQRAEEQGQMIESLHTSVAMYKRLYEEEHKLHASHLSSSDTITVPENGQKDFFLLVEGSQEASKKAQEKAAERLRSLEEELDKYRNDIVSLRSERDKLALDAKFANERLDSFKKEFDHQRNELTGIRARNVELSRLIVEYERKLRENSSTLQTSEENYRKLSMEVSVLKHEKDMLSNAEKRACDEVRSLSERIYRLQASLDTIQSAEVVREEARAAERRKQEEYIKQIEREWADAKKQLQQERDNVRALSSDRAETLKNAMKQVEEMGKELTNALRSVSAAETRASIAEAKLSDVEKKIRSNKSVNDDVMPSCVSPAEVVTDLFMAKEEIAKLKEEAQANKEHMLQYKGIAEVNEAALKQMEIAHENFKAESEKLKESLEAERLSLKERVSELEKVLNLKNEEIASAEARKEEALASTFAEITGLKDESSRKTSQIVTLEIQISVLKDDLEKAHERWQVAQANYERQVILQSETIQELAKTSQAFASLQKEASDMRKLADGLKSENDELKSNWGTEKLLLEELKKQAEKKYEELNEQNKILHSRLEALHIHIAEKESNSAGISSERASDQYSDSGLQNVVSYLRRSKEIAETEISLLKQEKLRLQSQLESALKAAETAQAKLHTERANSRALLFSEEDIKSLQLQVREMNLLRESNLQLREENKHNFEECEKLREVAQKARAHSDSLESILRERQIEIEACRKEIELESVEKGHLERRVSELLERSRNIDLEDYDRMKNDLQQLQEKLKDKEGEIEEFKSLMSKQQETISRLEQDLTKSETELNLRERRINELLQTEAALRSDFEKQKKLVVQWKKKCDILSKEKEESSKEKQALSKHIEDLKQGKRPIGNVSGEQIMKEKEEKDHRIQILEKTVERQREELKKEKEDQRAEKVKRQNTEKAIMDSYKNVDQAKSQFADKLEKHKQSVKQISDEIEKLKYAEGNLPEGTSVVQVLSGTILDDLFAPYASAVESFERIAHSVSIELGASAPIETTSISDNSTAVASGQAVSSVSATTTSAVPTSHLAAKVAEEKRISLPKTGVETRKVGRRLVRPRLVKPEEPQGDVADVSEADGSNTGEKLATSQDSDSQRKSTSLSQPLARKRQASSSSASDLNEQLRQEEIGSHVSAPVVKRPKGSDPQPEDAEGQFAPSVDSLVSMQAVGEPSDAAADLPGSLNEECVEKQEIGTAGEKSEPPKESEQLETAINQNQNEKADTAEEVYDRPIGTAMQFEEGSRADVEDNQQSTVEQETEREEGEVVPNVAEVEEVADALTATGTPERGDGMPDTGVSTSMASPARIDDEAMVGGGMELGEMNSPEVTADEKNDEGEENGEGSDKSNVEGSDEKWNDQVIAMETDQTQETSSSTVPSEVEASKQVLSSNVAEGEEVKQQEEVSASTGASTSTVVNLAERARQRAMLRQSGAGVLSSPGVTGRGRGSGRAVRGRGARIVRGGGRGQPPPPGQQG
ncbi:hypothetical protein K2173_001395 [Erythroxylum novogranatense]|uniref:Nucleoprotein TPR/MLP1 domain-containing protein n=1 Tax=Erythroxylum novogranatense TaxID=1862640 RepID=A0AAV8T5F4_9ROSI|nr:hypothetical protein K2173_001395 [Erythroxylum novogranatense]